MANATREVPAVRYDAVDRKPFNADAEVDERAAVDELPDAAQGARIQELTVRRTLGAVGGPGGQAIVAHAGWALEGRADVQVCVPVGRRPDQPRAEPDLIPRAPTLELAEGLIET